MLKDDYEKNFEKSGPRYRQNPNKKSGYFKEIQFTNNDWRSIKELNDELEVFQHYIILWFL